MLGIACFKCSLCKINFDIILSLQLSINTALKRSSTNLEFTEILCLNQYFIALGSWRAVSNDTGVFKQNSSFMSFIQLKTSRVANDREKSTVSSMYCSPHNCAQIILKDQHNKMCHSKELKIPWYGKNGKWPYLLLRETTDKKKTNWKNSEGVYLYLNKKYRATATFIHEDHSSLHLCI